MVNGKMGISLCKNKNRFNSLSKIDNSKTQLIVNPGGTNQSFVLNNIKNANVRIFDDNTKIFNEIIEKRADIMITDLVEALFQARTHSGVLCPTLDKPLTNELIASFMPLDRKWNTFVSKWFETFRETKEYRAIVKSYL
jgi:cyclohexadienyl dehydratase